MQQSELFVASAEALALLPNGNAIFAQDWSSPVSFSGAGGRLVQLDRNEIGLTLATPDGTLRTRTFSVGDEFSVASVLDVEARSDGVFYVAYSYNVGTELFFETQRFNARLNAIRKPIDGAFIDINKKDEVIAFEIDLFDGFKVDYISSDLDSRSNSISLTPWSRPDDSDTIILENGNIVQAYNIIGDLSLDVFEKNGVLLFSNAGDLPEYSYGDGRVAITALSDGGFAALYHRAQPAFMSADSSRLPIPIFQAGGLIELVLQRFDANGVPKGPATIVDTSAREVGAITISGNQFDYPDTSTVIETNELDLAEMPNGDLIASWTEINMELGGFRPVERKEVNYQFFSSNGSAITAAKPVADDAPVTSSTGLSDGVRIDDSFSGVLAQSEAGVALSFLDDAVNPAGAQFSPITGTRLAIFEDGPQLERGSNRGDTMNGDGEANSLFGLRGNDILRGRGGNDFLNGGDGRDRMDGGAGDDFAIGGAGNDRVWGRSGEDTLYGGAGNDRLFGNGGFDVLVGGKGRDVMTGGEGPDQFVFEDKWFGRDRITDFNPQEDKLDFSAIEVSDAQDRHLTYATITNERFQDFRDTNPGTPLEQFDVFFDGLEDLSYATLVWGLDFRSTSQGLDIGFTPNHRVLLENVFLEDFSGDSIWLDGFSFAPV
jgi:Ca2+-binding RTX toxin-like protein